MLRTDTIQDPEEYTIGTWTSQVLINDFAKFPNDVNSEWGFLSWKEENTSEDFTGKVRIDILDSNDNILISDIVKNPDGTPTRLSSTSASLSDIKIKVKIYNKIAPTPVVSKIWLNYRNWSTVNVVTNSGKNVMINRTFLEAPTVTNISTINFGDSQTVNFTEISTSLINKVGTGLSKPRTIDFDQENNIVTLAYELFNDDIILPNNTELSAIGLLTNDVSPIFSAATRIGNFKKTISFYYKFIIRFKVIDKPGIRYLMTKQGKNLFLERSFQQFITQSNISKFVGGYSETFENDMEVLDNEHVGPLEFIHALFDTVGHKVTLRAGMDDITGNGFTYNSFAHYNTDTPPKLVSVTKPYRDMIKTENYVYKFDTVYRSLTPINRLG